MSVGGGGLSGKEAPSLSVPYRYILAATAALAVLAVLLPFHVDTLLGFFITSRMLFLVHLATLGWITMTVIGASLQLVPVALQVRVWSERLAGWVFYLYAPGLLAMLYGFWTAESGWLIGGGLLVSGAATIYLVLMVGTVASAVSEGLVGVHLVAAFSWLLFTLVFGVLLVFNRRYGFLGASHVPSLASHGGLGLAGWFTMITYGVGYKLMGMFTLAEDRIHHGVAYAQLVLSTLGLLLLGGVGLAGGSRALASVGVAAVLAGGVLFAWQMVMLYRQRRRRLPDIIYPFVLTGVVLWVVALALAMYGAVAGLGADEWVWRTALWLGLFGWIGMMILGHMYKINTFLAWLHKYADLVGKTEVPKLDSLYEPGLGKVGWAVYAAGVVVAAVGLATASGGVLLAGLVALAVGVAVYLVNMGLIFLR